MRVPATPATAITATHMARIRPPRAVRTPGCARPATPTTTASRPVNRSLAADSYVPAPIPQDFGIHASKSAEPVVYTEFSGELINAFDRNIVERQCQMGRELGLTNKTPVFEAGYDKPNKFESQRFTSFTNEQHSATYTVTLAYGCDRTVEKAGSSADAMCDCTYRVLSSRRAEIKNRLPDGLEI